MRKPLLNALGSAPLAAVLAVLSAGVTLVVAVSTVVAGRVPSDAGLELIAALVLAAVAASEASRPQRRDRGRRRGGKSAAEARGNAPASGELTLGEGFDVDLG